MGKGVGEPQTRSGCCEKKSISERPNHE